jgi:hypothetical protein
MCWTGIKILLIKLWKPLVFALVSLKGIACMKVDIITSASEIIRYEKKNFADLACLLVVFSLGDFVSIFQGQNPWLAYPDRLLTEALQLAELAD